MIEDERHSRQISVTLEPDTGTEYALHTCIHRSDAALTASTAYRDIPTPGLIGLGWGGDRSQTIHSLVDGLNNEDVWLLIRRFNKVFLLFRAVNVS